MEFISLFSILLDHPTAVPDTPNSSLLSMSGQNMIEMTFPPAHRNHRANERITRTRTVGVQTGGLCLHAVHICTYVCMFSMCLSPILKHTISIDMHTLAM